MGDSSITCQDEKDPEVTKCDEPKVSIDVLRESKPQANIAIEPSSPDVHTMFKATMDNTDSTVTSPSNVPIQSLTIIPEQSVPTIIENLENVKETNEIISENSLDNKVSEISNQQPVTAVSDTKSFGETDSKTKLRISSASMRSELRDNLYAKNNSSDIFSLKDNPLSYDTIYSVNGSPSRKVFRKWEHPSQIFPTVEANSAVTKKSADEISTDSVKQRPNTVETAMHRNPVTGNGVFANDEYNIAKMTRRKDGNPVTGVGYDNVTISPSKTRIPPGGYSKGLW